MINQPSSSTPSHPTNSRIPLSFYRDCGLNGIVYNAEGYLLVTHPNTGNLYKVDAEDGTARRVILNKDLAAGECGLLWGAENRVYVLYGHVNEGTAEDSERSEFSVVEVEPESESKEENVWISVLIGFGFVYFLIWRFQIRHLAQKMNKKTA